MAQSLFERCKALYDTLDHKLDGENNPVSVGDTSEGGRGEIYEGTRDGEWQMYFFDYPDDSKLNSFSLNLPVRSLEVSVYAHPEAWTHGLTVGGATEEEVDAYLKSKGF